MTLERLKLYSPNHGRQQQIEFYKIRFTNSMSWKDAHKLEERTNYTQVKIKIILSTVAIFESTFYFTLHEIESIKM
jgi:hypothetical protein